MDEFLQWPDGAIGTALRWAIIATVAYVVLLWVALVAWVYRDIRQRTRDPLMQFVSVLLVLLFFLPGHWVYLILRPRFTLKEIYDRALEEEALLQELEDQSSCAGCSRRIRDEWLLCPSCGLQLKEPCETCAKPLSYAWVVCPHCGTEKAPRAGIGLRVPRARITAERSSADREPAPAKRPAAAARSASGPRTQSARPAPSRAGTAAGGRPRPLPSPIIQGDEPIIDATGGATTAPAAKTAAQGDV